MKRFLLTLLALLLALCGAEARPIVGSATNTPTQYSTAVIVTANTFQQVFGAAGSNKLQSLNIQNLNSDNCWISFSSSPTEATSYLLPAGAGYSRYWPYIPQGPLSATCATAGDTLYVDYSGDPPSAPLIGGVAPRLFADFASNKYFLNGVSYGDYNSWASAVGLTFTRASAKTVTNSAGILTQIGNNVVPFDYEWNGTSFAPYGLLMEGASTNIAFPSNGFTAWSLSNLSTPVQNVIGPDGVTNSAWTLTVAIQGPDFMFESPGTTPTTTLSIFAKYNGNIKYLTISTQAGAADFSAFNLQTGTIDHINTGSTATMVAVGNGWYRCSASFTAASTFAIFGLADTALSNSAPAGSSILVYGAQVENGQAFASSYVPTTSSTVTRAADSLTATPISSWYNASAGTLYADAATPSNDAAPTAFEIGDNTLSNRLFLGTSNISNAGALLALVVENNVQQLVHTGGSPNGFSKSAVSASVVGTAYVQAGGTPVTAGAISMPISPTKISIGDTEAQGDSAGTHPLSGWLKQIGYWPVAGTPTQLQALTSGAP